MGVTLAVSSHRQVLEGALWFKAAAAYCEGFFHQQIKIPPQKMHE